MSPLIFVSSVARALRALDANLLSDDDYDHEALGIRLDCGRCWGIWFADDAILLARSSRLLKHLLQRVQQRLAPAGLEILPAKCLRCDSSLFHNDDEIVVEVVRFRSVGASSPSWTPSSDLTAVLRRPLTCVCSACGDTTTRSGTMHSSALSRVKQMTLASRLLWPVLSLGSES